MELADQFGDSTFFEQATREVDVDPSIVAEIAQRLGREDDARYWFIQAAKSGDIDAIRELIENYDSTDLQRCWTWIYLARLLGTDLAEDDYHAIHEDGSLYDGNIGGPIFVEGAGGIELPSLPDGQDRVARSEAEMLFSHIPS